MVCAPCCSASSRRRQGRSWSTLQRATAGRWLQGREELELSQNRWLWFMPLERVPQVASGKAAASAPRSSARQSCNAGLRGRRRRPRARCTPCTQARRSVQTQHPCAPEALRVAQVQLCHQGGCRGHLGGAVGLQVVLEQCQLLQQQGGHVRGRPNWVLDESAGGCWTRAQAGRRGRPHTRRSGPQAASLHCAGALKRKVTLLRSPPCCLVAVLATPT